MRSFVKLRRVFTGVLAGVLATTLVVTDVVATAASAAASRTPAITLNGTVGEGESGFVSPKSVILASGVEAKVNFRLVPEYAAGAATGARVTLFLPSLEPMDRPPHRPLHNAALYWHFVDLIWVIVVAVLYVTPHLVR